MMFFKLYEYKNRNFQNYEFPISRKNFPTVNGCMNHFNVIKLKFLSYINSYSLLKFQSLKNCETAKSLMQNL